MARELTVSASVAWDDGVSPVIQLAVIRRLQTVTTKRPSQIVQDITTSVLALNMGAALSLGGLIMVVNLDPTNFVTIYRTSGPTDELMVLGPDADADGNGGVWLCTKLGSALLAPYAKADTAECRVAILTCPP